MTINNARRPSTSAPKFAGARHSHFCLLRYDRGPIRPPSPGKEKLAMSAQNKSSRIDEWMLQKVFRAAGQPAIRLGLRNGAGVSPKGALPVANIVIQNRKTL